MTERELIAYRIGRRFGMKLAVAPLGREWMNRTNCGFANRCLPMRIAGQAGWVVLNDRSLRAKWLGSAAPTAVLIECAGDPPYSAISHFGEGILTFIIPFLFRTPPGWALLFRGPANMPKDSVAPLEGLVETDWAVAASSMNWQFTRADKWVEFEKDEPICMVVPQRLDLMERFEPHIVDIQEDPDTYRGYKMWNESCQAFSERLRRHDPEAVTKGWQKYYFHGTAPHAGSAAIQGANAHRTQLKLREFSESCASPEEGAQVTKRLNAGLGTT